MITASKIEAKAVVARDVKSTTDDTWTRLMNFFEQSTGITWFTILFFVELVRRPYELKEFRNQCFMIGYRSLPLVMLTGFIMGLVLTIQSQPTLSNFGAESWLPSMVALSMVREIGPVITALIFAGKVGSSIGAELASMKVTEQIDAMEVSGINPFKYVVVTRVLATTTMLPLLVIFACTISFIGGFVGVNMTGDVSLQLFSSQVLNALQFKDIFPAIIKTVFFGFAIGLIGCYQGYTCTKGTEGVGESAKAAVVSGSIAIFILDVIAVQVTSIFI
jgi:phospholipid/cholesterol/gamma-HCH transport system permease protein